MFNQIYNYTNKFINNDEQTRRLNNEFNTKIKNIYNKIYYNSNKKFYVCSYGGSGSYMLCNYLLNFGKVYHIHSRNPPRKLTYIGCEKTTKNVYNEWFNDVEIPESDINNYTVIYIYKNPINAIHSRFTNPDHLKHIQCHETITLSDVVNKKADLYKIEEFFDNYTTTVKNRNYKIHCVKYETFWDNIDIFNKVINLPDIKELYPVIKETHRSCEYTEELTTIYNSLINKMNNRKYIETV